jgi:DNA invertase Pin-like site-specific DNA recombinase
LKGYDLVAELVENGRSAWSGADRPEYARLLDMIRADDVDVVVVWNQDRLNRSTRDLLDYMALCKDHGVVTVAVQGAGIDPTSPDGEFLATVLGAVAQQESSQKSARIRRAQRQAREAGVPVRTRYRTFGYEKDAVTVVEHEADFLRRAARRVIDGDTLRRIAIDGNAEGLKTTAGGPLTTTGLRRLLTNPRVAGLAAVARDGDDRPREVFGAGQWPAILPPETYEQVTAILADPSRRVNRPGGEPAHLLTGIATCPCGSPVCASWAPVNTRGIRHAIYRCRAKTGVAPGPGPHVSRRIADVDGLVVAYVLDMLTRLNVGDLLAEDDDTTGETVAALLTERDRLNDVLASLDGEVTAGTLTPARYAAVAGRVEEQLDVVAARLEQVTSTEHPTVARLAGVAPADIAGWWETAELPVRRGIVAELVTVELLPVPRGGQKGFDPQFVRITPRYRSL